MKDFNELFSEAYSHFSKKEFPKSLFRLAEAEVLLASSPLERVMVSVENLKGFNYLGMQDNKNAQSCFEKALNINPKSSQACAGLGEVFFLEGKDKEAKVMYEWAVINDPHNQFACNGLAKVNTALGLDARDNSLVEVEEEKNESGYKEMILTANKFFEEKNYGEVISVITEAERKLQEEIDGLKELLAEIGNLKGFAQLSLEDTTSARESFETTLNIKPDSAQACVGLGEVFFKNRKISEAKTMFEWGVKNDPTSLMAQSFLAKANLELGYPQYHNALTTQDAD